MSEITDLGIFAPEPKRVTLVTGGPEYQLPGDVPIDTALRIQSLAGQSLSDEEAGLQLYEEILALFQVYQPDMRRVPLQAQQLMSFIPVVYGIGADPDAEDPTQAAEAGTKSTTARKANKSRSSRSSAR